MSVELVAIVITGVVSGIDLVVTCVGMIMNGTFECNCCGMRVKHSDTEADLIEMNRRMSGCPPPKE